MKQTDRAMITFFETRFQDFAEGPHPVQELLRDKQFQTVQHLGTAGGTEMRLALAQIAAKRSHGRSENLILITGAPIGNELNLAPGFFRWQLRRIEGVMLTRYMSRQALRNSAQGSRRQIDLKAVAQTYGEKSMLNLTLAHGDIKRLVENAIIVRFMNGNHPDSLSEIESIASVDRQRMTFGPLAASISRRICISFACAGTAKPFSHR